MLCLPDPLGGVGVGTEGQGHPPLLGGMALQQLPAEVPCLWLFWTGVHAHSSPRVLDSARETRPLKSRWRQPCHSSLQEPQS